MNLDVGCGYRPKGDVNCDLHNPKAPKHYSGLKIDPKKIPNFVKCDANNLPFRDKIFSESFCSHVIEHRGVNPIKVLREMLRVTKQKLTVIVPHRYHKYAKFRDHDKFFSTLSFYDLFTRSGLKNAFPNISVKYRGIPNDKFAFVWLPSELIAEVCINE